MQIEKVPIEHIEKFRQVVEAYWQEIMPKADIIQDVARREAYFQSRFVLDGGQGHPYWAIVNDQPIGFLHFEVAVDIRQAIVQDFYVARRSRRHGIGSALVAWLFAHLDRLGIERIDLNVRRDNPTALAFWQAQGFGIALHHLRQYRDPKAGTAYVGALSSDF